MLDYAVQFLICGFLMGIVYDFFRFLRFVFVKKRLFFCLIFIFVIYSAVFSFFAGLQ